MKKAFYASLILILISGLIFSQAVLKKQSRPVLKVKPKITVQYPNGGELWKRGESYMIRWSSVGVKGKVTISVTGKKAGKTHGIGFAVTKDVSLGKSRFFVPSKLKGIYKARVRVAQPFGMVSDVSDADFTVLGEIKIIPIPLKSIKIIVPPKKAPGQYTTFYRNGRYAVMWKTTGKINNVGIKLEWRYKNEPPLVYTLAASTPNDGRKDIVITPNIPAIKYYKLIVFDTSKPKVRDSRSVNIEVH